MPRRLHPMLAGLTAFAMTALVIAATHPIA